LHDNVHQSLAAAVIEKGCHTVMPVLAVSNLTHGKSVILDDLLCMQGERMTTQAATAACVLAAVAGMCSLGLAAQAMLQPGFTSGPWLAVSLCVAAAAAWVAVKLNEFKEDMFVSGMRVWKKSGGLSLIKVP
jgi:hypothetical protein